MKKVIFFLLFSSFAFGQINIQKMCDFDYKEAKQFSDSLALSAKKPFIYYSEKVKEKSVKFYYFPAEFKKEEIDEKMKNLEPIEHIEVLFSIYMKGENKDLEIEGKKTYQLVFAQGKFLNIFPFWQKYFVPDANEQNYEELTKREFRNNGLLVKFDKVNDKGYWYIRKFYCP